MPELAILIPARNEEFLARTVEDITTNMRADTEIIVVLDGQWANPGLEQHPKVTIVYLPKSIGQRAATNLAARLTKAKYVMKVDAHCSFAEGFDRVLIDDMQDDWTVVPAMKNLQAFEWHCKTCGKTYPQGPTPGTTGHKAVEKYKPCEGHEFERKIIWTPKPGTVSTSYRFDKTLKFQYWGAYKDKQVGDLVESLSLQGSCFMMTREKYWELNICDEKAGSWGHQGSEVAIKTWLSGGRVIVNKKTWYAHMFRTQGGDFSFPWPAQEHEFEKARQYIRGLFPIGEKPTWPQAKYSLDWLIKKFSPVPEWEDYE